MMVDTAFGQAQVRSVTLPEPPSARLVLCLLGPPLVLVNGCEVLGLKAEKALTLLAYLAVEAHRAHSRLALAALFWPEQPEKQVLQNLRQTLSRLRRAIGDRQADPPHLVVEPDTIQFNRRSDHWCDLATCTAILTRTQRHQHWRLDACPTCLSQLTQACAMYRGEFLASHQPRGSPGLDEWLVIQRESLQQQACVALYALASSHLAYREPEVALGYAQRLLQMDPWNEAGQRLMLRALALGRGRNAALRHYKAFRPALMEELGVEPEEQTLALIDQIRAGQLAGMQPHTPPGMLPAPATSFDGREAELKRIDDSLAESSA